MQNPYKVLSHLDDGRRATCPQDNRLVSADDCESCISDRRCYEWCFNHLVWGHVGAPLFTEPMNLYGLGQLLEPPLPSPQETGQKRSISPRLRWEVWERDNFTCQVCGSRRYLSIDHIVPVSKGGQTIKENLQTLCLSCNSRKGDKA